MNSIIGIPFYTPIQTKNGVLTFLLINAVAANVCYWSCYLYFYVERDTNMHGLVYLGLWILTNVFFVTTTYRDPGVVG